MTARIGVTGSTGVVGGGVARALAEAGIGTRLIVRSAARAPELPGAEVAVAAYGDHADSAAALAGIQTLFMVSAAEHPDRRAQHLDFVDAAAAAGVQRIVYTSFFGASPESTFLLGRDHWFTEERIRASGMHFTLLRDNLYADFLPLFGGDDGVLRGPADDGRLAAVARADVIDVAVAVLMAAAVDEPGSGIHDDATYHLTGPQSLTLTEYAEILTRVTGRPFSFQNETIEEAYASRAVFDAPDWMVDAWVSTYTAIAAGEMDGVTGDVEKVSGHPPLSLEQLLSG
jgi:NAD(P)H dehydrogenase (quinone)